LLRTCINHPLLLLSVGCVLLLLECGMLPACLATINLPNEREGTREREGEGKEEGGREEVTARTAALRGQGRGREGLRGECQFELYVLRKMQGEGAPYRICFPGSSIKLLLQRLARRLFLCCQLTYTRAHDYSKVVLMQPLSAGAGLSLLFSACLAFQGSFSGLFCDTCRACAASSPASCLASHEQEEAGEVQAGGGVSRKWIRSGEESA